jgi:hypothetical protein
MPRCSLSYVKILVVRLLQFKLMIARLKNVRKNLYNQFVMEVLIHNDLRRVTCLRTKFIAQQFVYVWSYLGNFFKKIFEGRRDYPSLLPSCIGLE